MGFEPMSRGTEVKELPTELMRLEYSVADKTGFRSRVDRKRVDSKHSRLKRLGSSNARRSGQFNLVSLAGTHFFEGKSILHA